VRSAFDSTSDPVLALKGCTASIVPVVTCRAASAEDAHELYDAIVTENGQHQAPFDPCFY